MLDISFIRENKKKVIDGAKNKGYSVDVEKLLDLDQKRLGLFQEVQKIREQRNIAAKEKDKTVGGKIKDDLQKKEAELKKIDDELKPLLYSVPNIPAADVPVGKDENENEIVRTHGKPTKFNFKAKDHLELGELLDIIDVGRAAKVSGARFAYLKNEGALLEFALIQLAFQTLIKEKFIPVISPSLIKTGVMSGLGYMENGGADDMFHLEKDGLTLVGTAEHALVPLHMNELLQKKDLPLRYVGFSTSFRREAGSYGKDTRGTFRMHQFDKVEMVSFVTEKDDDKELEYLLSLEEKLFQILEIPYRVVKICTGDLGFPAARKYDIEAWIPSQDKYKEVTSVSTTTDFQARRLNIKYQDGNEKKYTHTLNGTAFAMSRTPIAILENYQQEDGSVRIPKALQSFVDFDIIERK